MCEISRDQAEKITRFENFHLEWSGGLPTDHNDKGFLLCIEKKDESLQAEIWHCHRKNGKLGIFASDVGSNNRSDNANILFGFFEITDKIRNKLEEMGIDIQRCLKSY